MMPTTRAASTPSRRLTISASNMDAPPLSGLAGIAGHSLRLGATLAQAVDLQAVARRHEAVSAADLSLQRRDAGAHELHHAAAPGAYQVIVPLAAMNVLEQEAAAPQTLLAGEAAGHQQLQVAVDGGARDLQAALPRRRQQLLGIDVAVLPEHLVEQRQPLGGDPVRGLAQEAQEELFREPIGHLMNPRVSPLAKLVIETLSQQRLGAFWTAAVRFVNRPVPERSAGCGPGRVGDVGRVNRAGRAARTRAGSRRCRSAAAG